MTTINFVCAADTSKYIRLITSAFSGRYACRFPEMESIASLDGDSIVHIHWEEFSFRSCRDDFAAMQRADQFINLVSEYQGRGGRVVLTIHNALPHRGHFIEAFLTLRRALGRMADIVLVHDAASAELTRTQIGDTVRNVVLPHPSSLDVYETQEALAAALPAIPNREVLGFGAIRPQKGFDDMIDHLSPEFLKERGARLRISGHGAWSESLIAAYGHRPDVHFDIRYVPDEETPALLRESAAVVLPYKRLLTSGVALLALTFGGVVVAPNIAPMRLLLPEAGQGLLFRPGDADDFRRAIDAVLALKAEARQELIAEGLEIARERHPLRISDRLAGLYDTLVAAKPRGSDA